MNPLANSVGPLPSDEGRFIASLVKGGILFLSPDTMSYRKPEEIQLKNSSSSSRVRFDKLAEFVRIISSAKNRFLS